MMENLATLSPMKMSKIGNASKGINDLDEKMHSRLLKMFSGFLLPKKKKKKNFFVFKKI